jgi:hypothetical protein
MANVLPEQQAQRERLASRLMQVQAIADEATELEDKRQDAEDAGRTGDEANLDRRLQGAQIRFDSAYESACNDIEKWYTDSVAEKLEQIRLALDASDFIEDLPDVSDVEIGYLPEDFDDLVDDILSPGENVLEYSDGGVKDLAVRIMQVGDVKLNRRDRNRILKYRNEFAKIVHTLDILVSTQG